MRMIVHPLLKSFVSCVEFGLLVRCEDDVNLLLLIILDYELIANPSQA